jgi:PAS domain S-box-containing protein
MKEGRPTAGRAGTPSGPLHARSKPGPPRRTRAEAPAATPAVVPLGDSSALPFRDAMEAAPVAAFVKDPDGRYLYANPYLLEIFGEWMGSDWYGKSDAEIWPAEVAALLRANDDAALRAGVLQVFSQLMPLTGGPHTLLMLKFPLPTAGADIELGGIGVDLTERSNTEAERDRLASAIEQAAESVMITDIDARITYVNPAFTRISGYQRNEVIGQNPRLLSSGLQSRSFFEAMWAALTSGVPWVADFINRHKDGSIFTEEAVISPIRNASGVIASFVAVKRDVTHERALMQRSTQLIRERALIAETIRGLAAGDTPEATAQALCHQVMSLTGVTTAQLYLFELDGRAMPIGFVVAGQTDPPLRRLPLQRSRHLRARAAEGPWIEPWVNRPWHPYNQLLTGLGVHAAAYAPVRHDQRLIGILVVDADDSVDEAALTEALPALLELADLAGALIGRDVVGRTEVRRGRDGIRAIIARRAFRPVFQPIVDLEDDAIVGYEALTRFADGAAPDVRFAEAVAVDLGGELETATLTAALTAARGLPRKTWLNLNVSPDLIIAGEPLRTLLRAVRRRVVLEVTEQTAIADYPAFRAALATLGRNVELAVDDAGAGFASLRHILELRPAFVKLDRWLVAGLESDEARQAMIAGMDHFARATGCRLIAEGIETEGELAILRDLNIHLGQGYLLGRPMPVDETRT